MSPALRASVLVALCSALVEVALRAEPRLGLSLPEALAWMLASVALALPVAMGGHALGAALGRAPARRTGLALGALLGLHAAMAWRHGASLNVPLSDPRVLGAMGGLGLGGLALGAALGPRVAGAWPGLAAIALVAAVAAPLRAGPGAGAREAPAGPNVLLISWDTTRPDRLSPYGGPAATPTLDRLAREGVVFEQAITTAPITEPAHLSMLTGLPTTETGVRVNGVPLGPQPALLSHAMAAAGLRTGAVVSGFPLHARWGWAQGFEVFDDDFGPLPGLMRLSAARLVELVLTRNTARERPGARALDRALAFLERHQGQRWFLFLHFYDPHAPYEARPVDDAPRDGEPLGLPPFWPPEHRSITSADYLVAAYDAELAGVDALTGRLLDALEAMGLLDETVILLTADHGESLTEHEERFDHGSTLYDPSLRVPLLLRLPGGRGAGGRVGCQVSLIDVVPTLSDAAGLPRPEGPGRSLLPAALGAPCESRPVVSSTPGERRLDPPIDWSLRWPAHKLIRRSPRGPGEAGVDTLFLLGPDPGEQHPQREGPTLAELARTLDLALAAGAGEAPQALDPAAEEALRALGYLE